MQPFSLIELQKEILEIFNQFLTDILRHEEYTDDYQKVVDGTIKYDDNGERIFERNNTNHFIGRRNDKNTIDRPLSVKYNASTI